jgi:hypothetical protein
MSRTYKIVDEINAQALEKMIKENGRNAAAIYKAQRQRNALLKRRPWWKFWGK